jgi:Flavinator of succinate dehydrogenase
MAGILARSPTSQAASTSTPSSSLSRNALSYLPRSTSSSSSSFSSSRSRSGGNARRQHMQHHHASSLNLCVTSAARSTSVHPSSLLSVWSPRSSSSSSSSFSSFSRTAASGARLSGNARESGNASAVNSPTFLSHRLAATGLNTSSSPALSSPAPSAMQLDYITTTSSNNSNNYNDTSAWIPSSPLLGLPGFVGPISACPSPVLGSGSQSAGMAGGRTIPLPSSSSSAGSSYASSYAASDSSSPGLSASPLPSLSSSAGNTAAASGAGRLHSNPLRPTIGGSPQRRHRHLFSPLSTSSSPSSPTTATFSTSAPRRSSQQGGNSGGGRKPSAADDPYPLPFSVELDPSQQGPTEQPVEPLRVAPQELEQGTTGRDFDADQHRGTSGEIDLATISQNDGFDLSSTPLRVPGREDEDRETKIARLIYQTRKRGTLETDLILSTFAKKELGSMSGEEVDEFDRVSNFLPSLSSLE